MSDNVEITIIGNSEIKIEQDNSTNTPTVPKRIPQRVEATLVAKNQLSANRDCALPEDVR